MLGLGSDGVGLGLRRLRVGQSHLGLLRELGRLLAIALGHPAELTNPGFGGVDDRRRPLLRLGLHHLGLRYEPAGLPPALPRRFGPGLELRHLGLELGDPRQRLAPPACVLGYVGVDLVTVVPPQRPCEVGLLRVPVDDLPGPVVVVTVLGVDGGCFVVLVVIERRTIRVLCHLRFPHRPNHLVRPYPALAPHRTRTFNVSRTRERWVRS